MLSRVDSAPSLSSTLAVVAAECLKVPVGALARHAPFSRYGLDSLGRVELTAALEKELGYPLPDSLLIECPDLASLESYLTAGAAAGGVPVSGLEKMRNDSRLPPDVRPESSASSAPGVRQAVLLTGATGFLGGYLLRSLLRSTGSRVYCLARAKDGPSAGHRIRSAMAASGIWEPGHEPRVEVVEGDLCKPRLGLAEARYAALCEEVGSVCHAAAEVDWVSPYGALRPANVLGTLELLRLACTFRPKPFHFVSTVAVCYSTCGPREVGEADDPLPFLPGIHLGYAQSKCVAEALVRQAGARGLPVTICRASLVSGDRLSGISNSGDLLSRLIRGTVRMGAAPDLDWNVDCCPVDYVADAVAHLTADGAARGVYHIVNPAPRHWRELVLWMNLFGYRVRLVPYREWLGRLDEEAAAPGHPLHELLRFFVREPSGEGGLTLPELYEDTRRSRLRSERTREALQGAALGSPRLDARLLDRYFASYIKKGVLPPAGRSRRPRGTRDGSALDAGFFTEILRQFHGGGSVEVSEAKEVRDGSDQSIVSELTSWKHGSGAGLRHYRLRVHRGGSTETLAVVVKRKASDKHVIDVAERVAGQCSSALGRAFARFGRDIGLAGSHLRELGVYEQRDERFRRHAPMLFGTRCNDRMGEWALVLEDISGLHLLDSAGDAAGWTGEHVEAAIRGLADLHSIWCGREAELLRQSWLGPVISAARRVEMGELWAALADHAGERFERILGARVKTLQRQLVAQVGPRWRRLESMPRTLIHNDFNSRNIALRCGVLCAYDWELATLGPPQHDLAELLCFVLTPKTTRAEVRHFLDLHRSVLEQKTGRSIEALAWEAGFRLSLHDLLVDRFALYAMIDRFRPQRFLDRVLRTWHALYQLFPQAEGEVGP